MPWEGPLALIATSLTGPTAAGIGLIGIVCAIGGIPGWRRPRQTPAARWPTAYGLFRVPAWSSNRWE
jgi:hypothetical protein